MEPRGGDPIKVLVVDDHWVVRQGLRMFLDQESAIAVVGEASDGREAIEEARRLRPDVVLMDILMPHMDGIEAITRIKAEMPHVEVIAPPRLVACGNRPIETRCDSAAGRRRTRQYFSGDF